jgi:peroxiredoxin Q/BCP
VRGIERSTFVIDGNGVLRREWRGVKVPGHAREVLDFIVADFGLKPRPSEG